MSAAEILQTKDFAQMSAAEIAEAKALIARLALPDDRRPTRRFVAERAAARASIRAARSAARCAAAARSSI